MNGTLKYDAEYIKTLLVDYYINQYDNIVIGSEVMYGTEKRIVDMLILKSGRTIAIEIKSKYDSFSRLQDQIIEYRKIFHYVYVAIDESFAKKLNKFYLPEDVGIIIISNNEQIKVYRKAKIQGGLEKKEILHTVNVDYIKKYYSKTPNGNSDEIRLLLEKNQSLFKFLSLVLFCPLSALFSPQNRYIGIAMRLFRDEKIARKYM